MKCTVTLIETQRSSRVFWLGGILMQNWFILDVSVTEDELMREVKWQQIPHTQSKARAASGSHTSRCLHSCVHPSSWSHTEATVVGTGQLSVHIGHMLFSLALIIQLLLINDHTEWLFCRGHVSSVGWSRRPASCPATRVELRGS